MFKLLSHLPDFPRQYVFESERSKYEIGYKPNQLKAVSSFNNTKFIKRISALFGECGGLYMKNVPMSYYDWHIDIGRKCSVNWLLKNPNGITLYRKHISAPDGYKSLQYSVTEVKYELYKPTILDVTEEHCVLNNTTEDRIIFSLSISAPYDEVCDYLSNLNIENY